MSTNLPYQPHYLPPPDRCSGEALIELAQIVKKFKNAAGEFTALDNITACFYSGEFVSVVGKSGSGKSTLANMITGIDHPNSGEVRVGQTYVHALSENHMSLWRGRNLGIVFQFFQLLPTLTLLENVMLPMYLAGLYTPIQREQRSAELLGMVGLAGFENKLPAAVSGGQQQSAAIARALANDPPILIADEPTGNLDSRTADEVFALFSSLVEQGKTILMVTHDISLARRTTRTLLIADGEIINAWVASALHHLGHSEMLWLSKNLKMHLYLPADLIYSYQGAVLNGGSPDWLALPVNGRLEVFESASARQPLYSISAGEYICSLALQPGQEVRAQPDEPIEVLQLSGSELLAWLNSHPSACQGLASGHPNNAVKIAQAGRP